VSANPRSRNMVEQSATATAPAKMPAIPAGANDFERAVKETLDVRNGAAGNPWEKWVTRRVLSELGLLGGPARGDLPTDHAGFAVWTGRGKFELLSALALAAALAEHLPGAAQAVSVEQFASLKRTVSALGDGLTTTELAQALSRSESKLAQQWARDIQTALAGQLGLVEDVAASLAQTAATARQQVGGYTDDHTTSEAVWTVAHGLAKYPLVLVLDATGEQVFPDIDYPDIDTVVITHGRAMTGTAIFR
jgi:hypothetical protein